MRKLSLFILLVWFVFPCQAAINDIEHVKATYDYISTSLDETPQQAERNAIECAKQKALEDKFGMDVSNVTNVLTSISDGNDKQSQSNFLSLGGISVRGEWIETTKQEILEKSYISDRWHVRVHVEGRARNKKTAKADIRYTFIRDIHDVESPVSFRDGNDIFLRFSSPVAGYLCVYLVDEAQNAYCLLPYMNQQSGSQAIEANREYIFFSEKYDPNAQEYSLNTEHSSEQNVLYVVFSPSDFTKASDKQGGKNFRNEQLLRELSYESFLKWLSKNQTRDPEMLVCPTVITIRK